ncbi:H-NS family nucleoid-associated regulatory protein [Pseudoalteromonas sp. YIC-827]|uniref:H-NS family nucleoid-associated regulatory protein n=1 Tax=Pseudoalteromonas qingdaonensis TaxID=3131913 RepID=A0ABU9MUR2_9GAMM
MREIRAFAKSASINELEKAINILNTALDNQQQQEKAKQEVLQLMKEKGLSVEDIVDVTQDKRTKVEPKYRREFEGKMVEWSGRGKRPKAFQDVELAKYLAK